MSRRILYIIDSLKIGGAEMLLMELLDAVRARGDVAHVAYFSPGPLVSRVAERGVEMTRLSRIGLRDPLTLIRALRLIRDWQPDIVHTHLVKSDLIGQMAARLTRRRRMITLHNTDPWRKKRPLSAIYHGVTKGADACIAVSDRVAEHVASFGGYRRDRIMTIANGIDLAYFDLGQKPLDLTVYGVPARAPVVAVIGSLTHQKDHENFVQAAATLAKSDPRPYFLIVGDGPLRERIAASINAHGDAGKRIILTGEISQMPQFLSAIDIMVISSRWEGLPMALLEGMAMRRAIVATAVGGIPDVIKNRENGRLVCASDPAALAQAMAELLDDALECSRLGKAARDTVVTSYDGNAMRCRLYEIYDALHLSEIRPSRRIDHAPATAVEKERKNGLYEV